MKKQTSKTETRNLLCAGKWSFNTKTKEWSGSAEPCTRDAKPRKEDDEGHFNSGLYCGKHELLAKRRDEYSIDITYCSDFPSRCGNINEDGRKGRCKSCRLKKSTQEKRRRAKYKEAHDEAIANKSPNVPCGECGNDHPIELYELASGTKTRKCPRCFEIQDTVEKNRPKRKRK
jgi:hypothetical protein